MGVELRGRLGEGAMRRGGAEWGCGVWGLGRWSGQALCSVCGKILKVCGNFWVGSCGLCKLRGG